ncbi:ScbA protein [Streptomyces sp. ISL-10]|uniref:ScbA/BarX family gamma-butyrolactone biosynthesis protein n=1 Tax=Streptomyces sp. ISL-10 TaxID=2819172 RepID=UPI001BED2F98|nr:ScbA/BarX family gamma-butyrolactone biosynthesis protein [Streptomyces sp. ISL-10]MBT2369082.1 ScbA protein [Streptomyces sp. ISL-10]
MSQLSIHARKRPARKIRRAVSTPTAAVVSTLGSRPSGTITPKFVHRVAEDDILITSWTRLGEDRFHLSADWTVAHGFFAPAPRARHNEMLVAQTIRQAGLLLAHAGFETPTSDQYLMNKLQYSSDPDYPTVDRTMDAVDIDVRCVPSGRRSLDMHFVFSHDGTIFVTCSAAFSWVPANVYGRLRGEHAAARPNGAPAPVAPAIVGRRAEDEVTLAPTDRPSRWELRGDTGHLALLDHPVDHVPGLVLVEAAHQAAFAHAGPDGFVPTSTSIVPTKYVEFDEPCWIEARDVQGALPGSSAIEVTGVQHGELTFRCVLTSRVNWPPAVGEW